MTPQRTREIMRMSMLHPRGQRAREVIDRLDGRPVQAIDRHEVLLNELTDAELCVIATGGRTEVTDAELVVIASGGRADDELEMKVIPPPSKD
jgi:hypothetical protein